MTVFDHKVAKDICWKVWI